MLCSSVCVSVCAAEDADDVRGTRLAGDSGWADLSDEYSMWIHQLRFWGLGNLSSVYSL